MHMQKFISCDWGSTALRLRLIDADSVSVLAEKATEDGIIATFNLWKKKRKNKSERLSFYQSILSGQINKLEKQLKYSLLNTPIIISGMASSDMGMKELPYKVIPFITDDLVVKIIEPSKYFKHKTLLVSGVRTDDDVMRGEETKLIGCLARESKQDGFFIFPGTHSKHVEVEKGLIKGFKTYMTGEFFHLLSKKSILSDAVGKNAGELKSGNSEWFKKGVALSRSSGLLHNSFLVRTNYLLKKAAKEKNYFFLSGLLIGFEIKELLQVDKQITLAGNEKQLQLYRIALSAIGIKKVIYINADKALIAGHCKLYNINQSVL